MSSLGVLWHQHISLEHSVVSAKESLKKNFWWLQNRYSLPKKHSFDVWKENRKSYWVLDQISQRLDHLILTVCQKWESLQASRPPGLSIVQWVVNIRLTPFRKTGALCQILFDRDIIMCCDSPPKVIKLTSRPAILRLLQWKVTKHKCDWHEITRRGEIL